MQSLFITTITWLIITFQYVTTQSAFSNSDDFDRKNRDDEKASFPIKEDFRRSTGHIADAHEVLRVALREFLDWRDANLTLYINKMRNQSEPFYDEFDQIIPHYKKVFRFISDQVDEVNLGNYAVNQFAKDRYDLCSVARYLSNQKRYPDRHEIVQLMGKALGQDCDPCIPYRRKEHEKRDLSDRPENQHPILMTRGGRTTRRPCPKESSQGTAFSITITTPSTTMVASTSQSTTTVLPLKVSFPDLDWQSDKGGRLKWAYNCDFYGSDISELPSNNKKEECRDKCYNTTECTHFVWNGFTCFLKHFEDQPTPGNFNRFNCGWISGRISQPEVVYTPKPDFKWNDDTGGMKWAETCQFYGPNGSHLETIHNRPADLCRNDCVALPNCTNFNWDGGECKMIQLIGSSVPAYNFDGTICGWIDHNKPIRGGDGNPVWQKGENGFVDWASGCFYHASDNEVIDSKQSQASQCGGICIANIRCNHFSYNSISEICYLISSGPRNPPSDFDGVCGIVPSRHW